MTADIDMSEYREMLPDGWVLDAEAEWPRDYDGFTYRLTAYNRSLDLYVRLSFQQGTTLPEAVGRLSDACRGASKAIAWGEERS